MTESKIQPSNITKPMQLLAAWLVGLLAIDGAFLTAASKMTPGSGEVAALVWAAIINVPIFIGALFLLQTRFRPELQEDLYYSTYINQKTNQAVSVTREEHRTATVMGRIERVENLLEVATAKISVPKPEAILSSVSFGINKYLADRDDLSKKIFDMGVVSHTWFGGESPPNSRVVSISEHLPKKTTDAVLALVERLGFTKYNFYDSQLDEIEEDVLIGSYGGGGLDVPRTAAYWTSQVDQEG